MGRGNVVSNSDIIFALNRGWIGGAVLDVFQPEPLDTESELWQREDVVITPHVAALSLSEASADSFLTNLDRFLKKEPLLYTVDWEKQY